MRRVGRQCLSFGMTSSSLPKNPCHGSVDHEVGNCKGIERLERLCHSTGGRWPDSCERGRSRATFRARDRLIDSNVSYAHTPSHTNSRFRRSFAGNSPQQELNGIRGSVIAHVLLPWTPEGGIVAFCDCTGRASGHEAKRTTLIREPPNL